MTRVLVCGGRTFGIVPPDTPPELIEAERARADHERKVLGVDPSPYLRDSGTHVIIHRAAPGADSVAARWAERHDVPALAFPAKWKKHGRSAGPLRNAKMLVEGRPDIVIAFPGGAGTADMMSKVRAAGVQVVEVKA